MIKPLLCVLLLLLPAPFVGAGNLESRGKVAIVLQAGNETNEGMARAVHALLYAREFADAGYDVVLIYDGAGTGWARELSRPESPLHAHYLKFKALGMPEEICDHCAGQFGHREGMTEAQRKLLTADYEGHPNLAKWAARGYQVVIL